MNRLLVPRLLTTGSAIGAATALRVSASCADLLARRTPPLLGLALRVSLGSDAPATDQAAFRDELIALARDSAELSWRELRRGVDWLDASTRPSEPPTTASRRPYRVKP